MKITVKVYEQGTELLAKVFPPGVYRFGRSEFSDVELCDPTINRSHLELRVTEVGVYMTNMSAVGQVKVNGDPREAAQLGDADELTLGPYRVIVFFDAEEPVVASSRPPTVQGADDPDAFPCLQEPPAADKTSVLDEGVPEGATDPLQDVGPRTSQMLSSRTQLEIKPVVAKLVFLEGPRAHEEIPLDAFEVTLGRSKTADIFLEDEKLSRIHSKISRFGNGFRLVDLNSRNGSFVNGMRVLEHPLKSFDEIQLGSSKIQFLIHDLVKAPIEPTGVKQAPSVPLPAAPPVFAASPGAVRRDLMNPLDAHQVAALHRTAHPLPMMDDLNAPWNQTQWSDQLKRHPMLAFGGGVAVALFLVFLLRPFGHKSESPVSHVSVAPTAPPPTSPARDVAQIVPPAHKDAKDSLKAQIRSGLQALKEGEFERAVGAFKTVLSLEPGNEVALRGLKAAQSHLRALDEKTAERAAPERDVEMERRRQVAALFQKAISAITNKSYQKAIDTAEKIRGIPLRSDSQYLGEAQQIIDRARMLQKEEYEPFLVQANQEFLKGHYEASRDLCEEMLKRDPAYQEAKECAHRAREELIHGRRRSRYP